MKFRKKPAVIEAVQFVRVDEPSGIPILDGGSYGGDGKMPQWVQEAFEMGGRDKHAEGAISPVAAGLLVGTLERPMLASPGDWIIRGVKGEVYPCKPDIFEATYDPA